MHSSIRPTIRARSRSTRALIYTPKPGYEQLGINGILGGALTQAAEEVDVNIVDAVRNDLVRISADVFAFDVAREWDVGIGSMNQIRADLMASTDPYVHEAVGFAGDLTPYSSWEDFQTRNNLSNAVIDQFKQAYPDLVLAAADIAAFQAINPGIELVGPNHDTVRGIDRVDLFVGGLAETHINGGVVGQTFWVILHEQLDRLQEGDRFTIWIGLRTSTSTISSRNKGSRRSLPATLASPAFRKTSSEPVSLTTRMTTTMVMTMMCPAAATTMMMIMTTTMTMIMITTTTMISLATAMTMAMATAIVER